MSVEISETDLIIKLRARLRTVKKKLAAAEHELLLWNAVSAAGVDNWDGYDYAIQALLEDHPDYFGDE